MKKIYLLFLGAILLGCNSTKNMMSSEWSKPDYFPQKLSKIAVIIVSDDHEVRHEGERALAKNFN